MATLRELEALKAIVEAQKQKISDLKQEILDVKTIVSELVKNYKIVINKSSSKENNNDLSIIFTKYKYSLLVKNKYPDKNTTLKCKNELKELDAKWFKNESTQGWLFVGICKDSDKSLEEVSQFIVDKLNDNKYNLEIEYE
uniref:Uncharacterized protein n=1 Tax=viral metagenome TaxID=1070528 RepID=A0A6C0LHE8_9ZZZZ